MNANSSSNSPISACCGTMCFTTITSHGSSFTHPLNLTDVASSRFSRRLTKLLAEASFGNTTVKSILRGFDRSSPPACIRLRTSPFASPGNNISTTAPFEESFRCQWRGLVGALPSSARRFLFSHRPPQEHQRAHHDRAIGHVEGRPVVRADVKVQKVRYLSFHQPVPEIPQRTTQN